MKYILSFISFTALFLALGLLAFLALPGNEGDTVQTNASTISEPADFQPGAPMLQTGTNRMTHISIPLTGASIPTSANGVASYIGSGVVQVLKWDPNNQILRTYNVGLPFGNFAVSPGDNLFIIANSGAPDSVTWVGEVPEVGAVVNTIAVNGLNFITVPLDQSQITTASQLAAEVGGVSQVFYWDANAQLMRTYNVGLPFGNFAVQAGHPYGLRTNGNAPTQWP